MSMRNAAILALIAEALHEVLPELAEHELRESDSLEELGANSMDRAEIVMTVLERMDLDLPLVETSGTHTAGELAERLRDKAALKAT